MNVLDVNGLSKSYGTTTLLSEVSFALGENEKVGIVGRNGCGKSTLFRILAEREEPDAGRIVTRRGLSLDYLDQRPDFNPEATVRKVLEDHLGEPREKLRRHGELSRLLADAGGEQLEKLLEEQQQVHSWLDHHDAWTLDHRIEEICTRFNIPDPEMKVGHLSGGWSQRVALAGMLLAAPDLLLLDEPTNQLDAETVEWLEEHLLGYPGAVLLVTHDRYFLDRVVSRMFELEDGHLTAYTGGYSAYLQQKAERLALDERSQTRLLNLLRREEQWLARGPKARTTKQKARIGRAEELRSQVSSGPKRELELSICAGHKTGGMVLEAEHLTLNYEGDDLVRDFSFLLRKGERIGILGPNGCGKTTLVRALLGELEPKAGKVAVGNKTLVGYLDQARTGLTEDESVADNLVEGDWVMVGGPRGERRHKSGYLEAFLFNYHDQRAPVSTLSGGERARLLLAKLLLTGANLIVLDEPTNDIDIPTLQVLDEALTEFSGSALIVTHDRYFLDKVATGILHFEGQGRVVYYEGNHESFSRLKALREAERRLSAAPAKPAPPKPSAAKPEKKQPAKLSFKEKKELTELEEQIAQLEERHAKLAGALTNPTAIQGGHEALQEISAQFTNVEQELEACMERWEELESKR